MNNNNNDDILNQGGPSTSPNKITRTRVSQKAGLTFPVSRVDRMLRNEKSDKDKYSKAAVIYMTATLEYICTEIIQFAGWKTQERKHKTLTSQDLVGGIHSDESLTTLLENNDNLLTDGPAWLTHVDTNTDANNTAVITKTPTRFMTRESSE